MQLIKPGGHRLFEQDPATAKVVSDMLADIEKNGLDAVRKYSRQFDDWNPDRFELTPKDIDAAMQGNICRCGTYGRIFEAVERTAQGGTK